jgi:hypothetical protein
VPEIDDPGVGFGTPARRAVVQNVSPTIPSHSELPVVSARRSALWTRSPANRGNAVPQHAGSLEAGQSHAERRDGLQAGLNEAAFDGLALALGRVREGQGSIPARLASDF